MKINIINFGKLPKNLYAINGYLCQKSSRQPTISILRNIHFQKIHMYNLHNSSLKQRLQQNCERLWPNQRFFEPV